MPIWFDTDEELDQAVADVAALSPAARRLLSEVIEHQGKRVTAVSKAALALEGLGFIFVRNQSFYDRSGDLDPSLWGEEALDVYETRKARKAA
jgi:hypothetical protein